MKSKNSSHTPERKARLRVGLKDVDREPFAIAIKTSCGNVYEDLQVKDAEAMHVKARLAGKIADIIRQRRLTQQQATEILGMPQLKLSGLLRGKFRGISEAKMIECLNRLGRNDCLTGDPEDIVHLDWSREWRPDLP